MSLWKRLASFSQFLFADDAPEARSQMKDVVNKDFECGPDPEDVGFTAAIIGLGAKLAKADGLVTADEVEVFSRVFRTAPEDEASVRRVFNVARQTVNGYHAYARRIGKRYHDRPCLLEGVLDGLFQIALADGVMTLDELTYLRDVSDAFGFNDDDFKRIKASHMGADPDDPYEVLGISRNASYEDIRSRYRSLMKDHHPDRMAAAKQAPWEYENVAHEKAASITSAFAKIRAERGMLINAD